MGCTFQKWMLRSPLAPTRFAVLRGMAEKAVNWRVDMAWTCPVAPVFRICLEVCRRRLRRSRSLLTVSLRMVSHLATGWSDSV